MLLLLHTKNNWPFRLKHPKTRFFKQKPGLAPSLNFMQKIRKILDVAPEKNSGQTNKETDGKKQKKKQKESILYRLHSMGPTNESA